MRAITLWVVLLLSAPALAGSAAIRKAAGSRDEAYKLLAQLVDGTGNPNTVINRIKFLGEDAWACHELAQRADHETSVEKRRVYAQTIAGLANPEGAGGLITMLADEDGAVRMQSAVGLGRMKIRGAAPKLEAALADKTVGVRREAARALGLIAEPRAGASLLKAAKTEDDPDARAAMLLATGQSGDKKQVAGLEAFLTHSSESARYGAAAGLCMLGAASGQKFAKEKLASTDKYDRMQGLLLFEGAKAKDAAGVLEPLLKDPDHALQAAAARILYQGGDATKLDWLVIHSFQALGEDRLPFEKELEPLRLADDQRREILRKAGIK